MKSLLFAALLALDGGTFTVRGKAVSAGEKLKPGVYKLSAGRAVVELPEGRILLKGPAQITLKPTHSASLLYGGLLAAFKRPFSLRTPTVVAAVRGTDFYVEERPGKSTYVCICDGKIDVSSPAGGKPRPMESDDHHAEWLERAKDGLWHEDAERYGHTDEDYALLMK